MPYLDDARRSLSETVQLAVLDGIENIYVAKAEYRFALPLAIDIQLVVAKSRRQGRIPLALPFAIDIQLVVAKSRHVAASPGHGSGQGELPAQQEEGQRRVGEQPARGSGHLVDRWPSSQQCHFRTATGISRTIGDDVQSLFVAAALLAAAFMTVRRPLGRPPTRLSVQPPGPPREAVRGWDRECSRRLPRFHALRAGLRRPAGVRGPGPQPFALARPFSRGAV